MDKNTIMTNKVRNRTMDMDLTYKCKTCRAEVTVKLGEILFLDDHGLRISERCKPCREKKNAMFENKDKEK